MKKIFSLFITLFMIFTIIGISAAIYLSARASSGEKKVDLFDLSKTAGSDTENILVMGVDQLSSTEEYQNIRTDTMMVFSVNPKTKTGYVLSIPRDTWTQVGDRHDKINHAHSYGGVEMSIDSAQKLLGIPIHHYIKVDYNAVSQMVDAMGGVEVNVPMDMFYEDPSADPPLYINLKAGEQNLNGDAALQFLRFRKGYSNQDLGRIESQQQFIKSVINKLISPVTIVKLPSYIKVLHDNVQTDMSIMDMMKIAAKSINIKPHNIKRAVVPGYAGMKNGISYYFSNDEELKTLMEELNSGIFYRDEAVDESGNPVNEKDTMQAINKNENSNKENVDTSQDGSKTFNKAEEKTYSIKVLNGGGVKGKAQRAADLLKLGNLEPQNTGNADSFDHNKTIIYTDNKELGKKIKEILGTGSVKAKDKNDFYVGEDALIILGKDFDK